MARVLPCCLVRALVPILAFVAGCGAPAAAATRVRAPPACATENARLRAELDRSTARAREIEGRLALAESEARELRDESAHREASAARPRTVRIGSPTGASPTAPQSPDADLVEEEEERLVLRLHEVPVRRQLTPAMGPLALPPRPQGVPDRLPVVPIPGEPAVGGAAASLGAPPEAAPSAIDATAVAEYRAALADVRAERFDRAVTELAAFLARFPRHPYADNAMYWRGEVFYARRDYARALAEFEALIARYPNGNKVPDALLKMAMCHRRMGYDDRSRELFRRVQREFPESDAARLAAREDRS